MELDHARNVAVEAAEAAGAMLRHALGTTTGVHAKGDAGDVVTDLDLAAEKILIDRVLGAFPAHAVLAEESGALGEPGSRWSWLIDPLDGTNNLAIGLPAFVVGMALCDGERPVVGVVHEPVTGHTWSAVRGAGTTGPAGPVAPPYRPAPHGPVLAWTQGYAVARDDPAARALKLAMEVRARRVLQLWAPLLSWVMLARGDIHGIIGYRTEVVDLPAGMLIAQEAGIAVRALAGGPFDDAIGRGDEGRSFVAGHPEMLGELLELAAEADRTRTAVPSST
ncbi:inositol monophosphatase family protein [Sinosporangium siamense]|uniref:Inositol monophosphatase n=1 Tax=Sinosporangium siamense TaxID=1367973 RepID=A0A919RHA5_9ACTN|nr:inositol monophosphatase [Sinosporangium siamense]GII92384.1 inositol monophosphatase [Sinosporangium siamense]